MNKERLKAMAGFLMICLGLIGIVLYDLKLAFILNILFGMLLIY